MYYHKLSYFFFITKIEDLDLAQVTCPIDEGRSMFPLLLFQRVCQLIAQLHDGEIPGHGNVPVKLAGVIDPRGGRTVLRVDLPL